MRRHTVVVLVIAGLVAGAPAWAQDPSPTPEVRPAVTSFWGDTGLWFVPTAEVLKARGWALGAYRTELDFKQDRRMSRTTPRRSPSAQEVEPRSLAPSVP